MHDIKRISHLVIQLCYTVNVPEAFVTFNISARHGIVWCNMQSILVLEQTGCGGGGRVPMFVAAL
jgi:hypothetical protein